MSKTSNELDISENGSGSRQQRIVMCVTCQGSGLDPFKIGEFIDSCEQCFGSGIPPSIWSRETKTEDAKKQALRLGCLNCRKPLEKIEDIGKTHWYDTMEPDNGYIFCKCMST